MLPPLNRKTNLFSRNLRLPVPYKNSRLGSYLIRISMQRGLTETMWLGQKQQSISELHFASVSKQVLVRSLSYGI